MARRITQRRPALMIEQAGAAPGLPETKPFNILVAGELILDRYLWGDVSRISPEAPIPILQVTRREEKPGNSGFVMANLRALGAQATALSMVGADREGERLKEILRGLGVMTSSVLTDSERPTIVKQRMLGSVQTANRATQQLLRVDEEEIRPITPARERMLKACVARELAKADGVLISDIAKGLL
ncbi:MAG: bifunctional heptose 7-phosphate kinase/heptose 1-phosphate adenyltransferase, partial [Candidatus Binataceae bacterium]